MSCFPRIAATHGCPRSVVQAARKIRFLEVDGREGVEGGGEEEGLGGGGRAEVLLRRERGGTGGGAEGGGSGRREGGEPVHGRQLGAPHRPRN